MIAALLTEISPSTIKPSAKISCPVLNRTKSPTTRSSLLIVCTLPSRTTSQYLTAVFALNSAADFCMPRPVLTAISVTIAKTTIIITGSERDITPIAPKTNWNKAIIIRIIVIGSVNASLTK